jgi:hypothetical protein
LGQFVGIFEPTSDRINGLTSEIQDIPILIHCMRPPDVPARARGVEKDFLFICSATPENAAQQFAASRMAVAQNLVQ